MKLGWPVAVLAALLLGGVIGWRLAPRVVAQPLPAASRLEVAARPQPTASPPRCRSGAFLEASRILNAVTDLSLALPANTSEAARGELDAILYTALKQAQSEAHCVAGNLPYGYDQSFSEIVRRAVNLGRARGLSRDVTELGQSTLQMLEQNRPAPR